MVTKMAISKITERRSEAKKTLNYVYRGDGHEHEINLIQHIGGNIFASNPIIFNEFGLAIDAEIEEMDKEFEQQAAQHKGKGEKLFKHYIISLAHNESLEAHEWFEHINDDYLPALGYDDSCRWTACIHNDKDHQHLHIFTCLVKDGGSLVKTHNDAHAGFESMRRLEDKYELQRLDSPQDNWGVHLHQRELKATLGDRDEALSKNWRAIINARFKAIEEESNGKLPSTMSSLVLALAKKNVEVKVRQDDKGNICGISYKADSGPFLSGSKVKKTRLTFKNLQTKEGVCYVPARDNAALGAATLSETFRVSININFQQAKRLINQKASHRVRVRKENRANRENRENRENTAWIDLTFCRTQNERSTLIAIAYIMKFLQDLFDILNNSERMHLTSLRNKCEYYDNKYCTNHLVYNPKKEVVYNLDDIDIDNKIIKDCSYLIDSADSVNNDNDITMTI